MFLQFVVLVCGAKCVWVFVFVDLKWGGLTSFIVLLLWFYLFITNSRSTRIGAGAVFIYIVIPRGIINRVLGYWGVRGEELCYKQVRWAFYLEKIFWILFICLLLSTEGRELCMCVDEKIKDELFEKEA